MIFKLVGVAVAWVILMLMAYEMFVNDYDTVTSCSDVDSKRIHYVNKKGVPSVCRAYKKQPMVIGNLLTPVCDIRLLTLRRVKLLIYCEEGYTKLGIMAGNVLINDKLYGPNKEVAYKIYDEKPLCLGDNSYLYFD